MSADAKLKAYIDRILHCRQAEDDAKKDTKEVYAELAGDGYEKSIVGQVVNYLRKREKDGDKLLEQSEKFDLYLGAYERSSHVHAREGNSYAAEKGIDREARRKQRMSESMDDSVALSAEAVALGLIDPAAHEETVRIADAVARKFGNGPLNEQIDPDTGEITNPEAKASEDNGVTVQGDESPADSVTGDASRPVAGRSATATSEIMDETGGESAATNFEPAAFLQNKPTVKTIQDFRPHCQKPDACGASGLQHCYSCSKLIPEISEVA